MTQCWNAFVPPLGKMFGVQVYCPMRSNGGSPSNHCHSAPFQKLALPCGPPVFGKALKFVVWYPANVSATTSYQPYCQPFAPWVPVPDQSAIVSATGAKSAEVRMVAVKIVLSQKSLFAAPESTAKSMIEPRLAWTMIE